MDSYFFSTPVTLTTIFVIVGIVIPYLLERWFAKRAAEAGRTRLYKDITLLTTYGLFFIALLIVAFIFPTKEITLLYKTIASLGITITIYILTRKDLASRFTSLVQKKKSRQTARYR